MIKEWTLKRDNNGGDIRIRLSPSGDVTVIYANGETRSFSRAEGREVWDQLIDAGWYAESLTPTMRPNRSKYDVGAYTDIEGMNGPHENELMEARIDPKKYFKSHISDWDHRKDPVMGPWHEKKRQEEKNYYYENYALEA
tara:strand:- start:8196 stop:8615 length:420 start_codon:yes stop_codon:yes gene_type:complete